MARQERSKKSTITNMAETFRSANELPDPTEPMDERERAYFERIVRSREGSTWSDHDLSVATQLAMIQVQFFDSMESVKTMGRTIRNDRGTPVMNPESSAMASLSSAVKLLSSALGLTASQRGVAGPAQAGRNQAEQEARKIIGRAMTDHDDLI